jgi:hypothetical protein
MEQPTVRKTYKEKLRPTPAQEMGTRIIIGVLARVPRYR